MRRMAGLRIPMRLTSTRRGGRRLRGAGAAVSVADVSAEGGVVVKKSFQQGLAMRIIVIRKRKPPRCRDKPPKPLCAGAALRVQ
jgi:hypothetical protein